MPVTPAQSPTQKLLWADALLLFVAAALLVGMRLHAFDLPLETDECNYIYTAARLLAGDQLYTDVWDHQPPGIFAFFAVVIALFGDTQPVFRWLATAACLTSLLLLVLICRHTAGRWAGHLAALLYALISADPGTAGEGCNREIFMNPLALAAVWLLISKPHPPRLRIVLAGLLIGMGSLIKTVLAAPWMLLAVWLVWHVARTSPPARRRRAGVVSLLLFAAGPVALWLFTGVYFAATVRFDLFYEAVFTFNLSYADTAAAYAQRFLDFFHPPVHRHVFDGTLVLWIVAAASLASLPWLHRHRPHPGPFALMAYLLGSYWAVCLPGQLWPHYYYLMLPPLVAVTATALGTLISDTFLTSTRLPLRQTGYVIAAALLAGLALAQAGEYLLVPTQQITDKRYDSRDLWGRAQGANVASVTKPGDTILVYGTDAGIYYYSGRRCASRFTMVRALADSYPGFQKRRAQLMEDLSKTRPRLILLVETPFPALDQLLQSNYTPAGADHHDRRTDEVIMEVWMDRTRPVAAINWEWHRSQEQQP